MITLGVILLILGIVLDVWILYAVGGILLVLGVIFWLLGAMGRAVGGRRHYYLPKRSWPVPLMSAIGVSPLFDDGRTAGTQSSEHLSESPPIRAGWSSTTTR